MPMKSPYAPVDIPAIDIWTHYMEQPRKYPVDHPIFVDCDSGRSYSYANIKELATEFGKGLSHALQWNKGDIMCFFTPNDVDVPVLYLGIHWAGGIACPANPTYTVEELVRQLQNSGAKALITQKAYLDSARKAAKIVNLPLDRILLLGDERDETGVHRHWKDINAKGARVQPRRSAIDPKKDLAYLMYSSGTTGLSKGVMITHSNIVSNAYQTDRLDVQSLNWDSDAQLGLLPLFHIYALCAVVNTSLSTGAKSVILPKFDLEKACKLIQDHKITFIYLAPPVILALGKHPVVSKYDLSSLRWITSAAAPISVELILAVWERLNVGVKQAYGLSETSPLVMMQLSDEWMKYRGSVGKLALNMEAKIVDEEDRELGPGQSGELLLKGPNVFLGYWKLPELNKETFTEDGWYRTGDIFYVNPQGHFYITDRKKELIKYNGFQVAPAELEATLIGHKDVDDVCVLGVWDKEHYTEIPRAYVVLRPGVEESEEKAKEIIEWLNAKVSYMKKLRGGVRFTKEIPKSQTGKILRRVLRDRVKEEEEPRAKL